VVVNQALRGDSPVSRRGEVWNRGLGESAVRLGGVGYKNRQVRRRVFSSSQPPQNSMTFISLLSKPTLGLID
jgi:hypothetical protein